ncbi:MAG: sulfurtransferase TusA family protein [Rhodobacteraceae bacterium]|nr:sulfurtransferase TusA family protein [Paracoccaceae bacterium]
MNQSDTVDAIGLLCPLPVLRVAKRMRSLKSGDAVCVVADDPAAEIDIPNFCREQGHTLVGVTRAGDRITFEIRKS